jgi:hypothetical protein
MVLEINKSDTTRLFTVVGAPYVAEQHTDGRSHYQVEKDRPPPDSGVAGLWAIFYAVLAGSWLFSGGAVGKAVEYAVALLK